MTMLIITLRILHIIAGILWAGGAILYFMFIEPAAKATAPESQRFMGYLMTQKRFSKFMGVMSLLTIVAGAALYYRLGSVNWQWITTGPGIGFTMGALAGISAYLVGNLFVGPRAERLGKLSQELQAAGSPPSAEQTALMDGIQREMDFFGKLDFALIAVAMLTMSTARYWSF